MVPIKAIPNTLETPSHEIFCIYCAFYGLVGSEIFQDHTCSSKGANRNSDHLPPLSTAPNFGLEEQEDGSPIQSDDCLHHHDSMKNSCTLDDTDESDPQFRLRLSSKLPYWPNYDNSGPIAYAEMNQMYERVGIRLERSSSSILSDMVSSPTSTPPRVFDDSDADDFDYDDNNGVEEGIGSNYFEIYAKEARCEIFDNDLEVIEKSLYLSSHTDHSGINSDVPTINTRCRSQSQSSGTMVSVTGDAHLTRLRQACEEHISLSHELETNFSRSLKFKLRFESDENVNIVPELGVPTESKEKLEGLKARRLESSGSRGFFSRFIPWKKIVHLSNTSRYDNNDHDNGDHKYNGEADDDKRNGCSISLPVIGSEWEGERENIQSSKLSQASSSDLKSHFHTVSGIEMKKNLNSSPNCIKSCENVFDNTGTTSPTSTVVSTAFSMVDLSCNSGTSMTSPTNINTNTNTSYSITGTKDGDDKLIKVSIAFSEVLQLQGNATDAVVMMENLLKDLESCLLSRRCSICLQSTSTSSIEETISKKRVQFDVNVDATGTDRDITQSDNGGNSRTPILCHVSTDAQIQLGNELYRPCHYSQTNGNECRSSKTNKNIEEDVKTVKNMKSVDSATSSSYNNLVEESTVPIFFKAEADDIENADTSEYMWYKRNVAICHRRLGVLYKSAGRLREAEDSLRNFILLREEYYCNGIDTRRDVANAYCLLAAVIDQIGGRVDEAIAADKISIDMMSLINS